MFPSQCTFSKNYVSCRVLWCYVADVFFGSQEFLDDFFQSLVTKYLLTMSTYTFKWYVRTPDG